MRSTLGVFFFFVHLLNSQKAKNKMWKQKLKNEMSEFLRCHNINNNNNSFNNRDKPRWIIGWMTIHEFETHQYKKAELKCDLRRLKMARTRDRRRRRKKLQENPLLLLLMNAKTKDSSIYRLLIPMDHHHHLYSLPLNGSSVIFFIDRCFINSDHLFRALFLCIECELRTLDGSSYFNRSFWWRFFSSYFFLLFIICFKILFCCDHVI